MSKIIWLYGFLVGLLIFVAGLVIGVLWTIPVLIFGEQVYAKYEGVEIPDWWWSWIKDYVLREDTLAQWIMAFFTIAVVLLVWRTLKATQEMAADTRAIAQDTRRIGETQVRAHPSIIKMSVTLDKIEVERIQPLTWISAGNGKVSDIHPNIIMTIRNFGASHADDVSVRFSLKVMATHNIQGQICAIERQTEKRFPFIGEPPHTGRIIPSGNAITLRMELIAPLTEEEVSASQTFGEPEGLYVGIVATLTFNDVFGNTISKDYGFIGGVHRNGECELAAAGDYVYYRQDEIKQQS